MDNEEKSVKHRINIRREYVLQVRLRDMERDELKRKSEVMGINPSAYARMAIKNYRRTA